MKLSVSDITRIRNYREMHGCSLQEAKHVVVKENLIEEIDLADTVDDIKDILMKYFLPSF